MQENPTNLISSPKTDPESTSIKRINSIKNTARLALTMAALALPITACGPGSTFQMEKDADAGADDANQDAPLDTTPDTDQADTEPEAGCTGTELTFHDMKQYEVLHSDHMCSANYVSTAYPNNENWESEPITLCVYPGDTITVITYYSDQQGDRNNLYFSTNNEIEFTEQFRSGVNVKQTVINENFSHSLCQKKLQDIGYCYPWSIEDQDPSPTEFFYEGDPGCHMEPENVANSFYFKIK